MQIYSTVTLPATPPHEASPPIVRAVLDVVVVNGQPVLEPPAKQIGGEAYGLLKVIIQVPGAVALLVVKVPMLSVPVNEPQLALMVGVVPDDLMCPAAIMSPLFAVMLPPAVMVLVVVSVETPEIAPLLMMIPFIVFVVVGAVIAPLTASAPPVLILPTVEPAFWIVSWLPLIIPPLLILPSMVGPVWACMLLPLTTPVLLMLPTVEPPTVLIVKPPFVVIRPVLAAIAATLV